MKTNSVFMWDFHPREPVTYVMVKNCLLKTNITRYDLNSLVFRGSLSWNTLANSVKISRSLTEFKIKLRHFGYFQCIHKVFL